MKLKDVVVLKPLRALLLVAVFGLCLWLVLPVVLQQPKTGNSPADDATGTAHTVAPVPTPDLSEIAPVVTASPTPTPVPTASAVPSPTADAAAQPGYVLDLWLDGSPNVAGISPYDNKPADTVYKKYVLVGGFLYQTLKEICNESTSQTGWYPTLLNFLYGKEMLGQTGRVRVLRYAPDAVLTDEQLAPLVALGDNVSAAALRRDTMTYTVFEDNSVSQNAFFLSLLGDPARGRDVIASTKAVYQSSNFFTPGSTVNNRVSSLQTPETANAQAFAQVGKVFGAALNQYKSRLATLSRQRSESEDQVSTEDPLQYALDNMDPTHLNVLTLDTLGLPETDGSREAYLAAVQALIAKQPDLAIAPLVCRLDYAGLLSGMAGRTLKSGILWGYLEYLRKNGDVEEPHYAFALPMPRALLVLAIGPGEQVRTYLQNLTRTLDLEMQAQKPNTTDKGLLSGERGDVRTASHYKQPALYLYNGLPQSGTRFPFAYRYTVLEAMDVLNEQISLCQRIGELAQKENSVQVNGTATYTGKYSWVKISGVPESTVNVPIVTVDFRSPVTVSFNLKDLTPSELDAFNPARLTVQASIRNSLLLRQKALRDLRQNDLVNGKDQAYTDDNANIYIYSRVAGSGGLALSASQATITGTYLTFALSAEKPLAPGYYWVTLTADYQADAQTSAALWNPIPAWAAAYVPETAETAPAAQPEATAQPPADPAVFDPDTTWDYTPNGGTLKRIAETDASIYHLKDRDVLRVGKSNLSAIHAWGASAYPENGFPTNVPAVFRVFQLNRILATLREGLFLRAGEDASVPVFQRQLILYVAMAQ